MAVKEMTVPIAGTPTWGSSPGVRRPQVIPDGLISIPRDGSREAKQMVETRVMDPPGLWRSPRYANIVVAGIFAFIAGQTAFDERGDVVGVGDIERQCAQTLENLSICLQALHATPADIVKMTNYVTDRAYLQTL